MKKNLLVILFTAFAFAGVQNANAQLASGCIAPDFTATDINGNSWHLYDILDQGKTVFIDISATWCGPCWNYHNTGYLETLYNQYGPSGTDELRVFYIEGDHSTNTNCLYGSAGCNSTTQGDWVTGTPYPIIDDNATWNIAGNYAITYFPTIYMITPDRIIRENSQITTAQHYAAMQANAYPAIATADAEINWGCSMNQNISGCSGGVSMNVRLFNASTVPMTSATLEVSVNSVVVQTVPWTGNLATYAYTTVNITGVTGPVGANTAVITVTNVNGGADTRAANNSTSIPFTIYSNVGGPAVTQAFPSAVFPPSGWTLTNGGSGATWTYSTAGFNGAGSAKMDFYNAPAGEVDVLSLPPMDFTNYSSASLTFDRSHKMYASSGYNDNLKVRVSTNCGSSWTNALNLTDPALANVAGYTGNVEWVPALSTDWAAQNVVLNSYLGNSNVIIKFEALSGYGNQLYIDNVNVNLVTSTGNIVTIPVKFELYPNPAATQTTVTLQLGKTSDVTVNVVNTLGQVVQSTFTPGMSAAEHTFTINTEKLTPGVYHVNVISAEGVTSQKLVKE
jgi:Secretion system C-terminal sorting domain